MRFDLIRPCENCPFRTDETRITFACAERAIEIEEIAYRQGFVCHKHGEFFQGYEGQGYVDFREDGSSQHCFGALFMYLRHGGGTIPWDEACCEDESLEERWWSRITDDAFNEFQTLIWEDEDAFIAANSSRNQKQK